MIYPRALLLFLVAWLLTACGAGTTPGDGVDPGAADVTEDVTAQVDVTAPECVGDEDCDDGVDCTVDFCEADGRCSQTPNDSLCSDGDLCTGAEICDATLGCRPGEPLSCDDGVGCTTDTCDPVAGCAATPDDLACSDSDLCNGLETCDVTAGCQPGEALECDDGVGCTVDTCDATEGCVRTPDDATCSDSDVCTGVEVCDLILGCQPGESLDCDDGVGCTVDTCDAAEGCVSTPDDAACSDSDVCTGVEVCDVALDCQLGESLDCDDGVGCTADSCDATDGCVNTPEDAVCDDGLICTGVETCDGTLDCQAGTPPEGCCTDDASCDDQSVCNGIETCDMVTRTCALGESLDCDDGVPCTVDDCDATEGCMSVPDDPVCDDGIGCTTDTCDETLGCTSVPEDSVCDDGVGCTADSCDAEAGCVNAADDAVCDDGSVCTGTETCDAALDCQPGEALDCDDGVGCTVDSCDAEAGCDNAVDDALCDDASVCTGTETCDAAEDCQPGEALDCDDGVGCTADSCDAEAGCVNAVDDAVCDDASVCTGTETCDATLDCQPGEALNCDDGVGCTVDSCDAVLGCGNDPDHQVCDDGLLCTGVESCDLVLDCQPGEPLPNCCVADQDCDDGLICTGVELCDVGANLCQVGTAPSCDDEDACTIDSCSEGAGPIGCVNAPAVADDIVVTLVGVEDGGAYAEPVTVFVAVEGPHVLGWSTTLDGVPLEEPAEVASDGLHTVVVTVEGCGIEPQVEVRTFFVDSEPPVIEASVTPPANEAGWHNGPVLVTFAALDALTTVTVTEPVAVVAPGADQVVTGTATDAAGNTAEVSVTLHLDFKSPSVTIDSPVANQEGTDQHVTSVDVITFEGLFGDDTLSGFAYGRVSSSKQQAAEEFDLPGAYSTDIALEEGVNTVIVSAHDVAGNAATASICVIRDSQSPYVFIQSPTPGHLVSTDVVDVSGLAHDLVVGEVTPGEVDVTLTTSPGGVVVDAVVQAGHFLAGGVPLELGTNTLTATATDGVGLVGTHSVTVVRHAGDVARLEVVSGNFQTCTVGTQAAEPLVVRLLDAEDTPVPGVEVAFAVTGSDGVLWADEHMMMASPNWRRCIMETDEDGLAQTWLTCGTEAGAGIDRVTANGMDVMGSVNFFASPEPATAAEIHLHGGDGQQGATGEPLPMPFAVLVTDLNKNPVSEMAVTFSVVDGDGKLGGQSSVVVTTNAKGVADVVFVPGQIEGYATHKVLAQVPPVEGSTTESGVTFIASAFAAGNPDLTRVSGLVVDQDEVPLAGVTIRFPDIGDPFPVVTGVDGTFSYVGAPEGFARMIVDGSTVPHEGVTPLYPTMTMEVHNIAGQDNRLDRPVYILKLDNPVWVDGMTEVVLTLDEVPGYALTIPAGTHLTFPDGSHAGWLSVTQVHFDQAPMAPPDGVAPRMLTTIQPPGVHFDPPAPHQVPNVDGYPPGQKVELFSYDHDLETFVTIGLGSVSEDGTTVRSDPGVGIAKGGWHAPRGRPPGNSDPETISASVSAPANATGPGAIEIGASGSPGPDTAWVTGVCDGSGALSCSETSCEGSLSGTPSRVTKVRVKHYNISDPSQYATDEATVTVCGSPMDSQTFNIPGVSIPSAASVARLFNAGNDLIAAAHEASDALGWFGGACTFDSEFKPKLEGSVTLGSGCCPGCPSTNGSKVEGNLTLKGANAGYECLFTHPALLALTNLVSIANNLKANSDHDLAFEVGVKAEVQFSGSGNVKATADTCEGTVSVSGGGKVGLDGNIGGHINVQGLGLGLSAFVRGEASVDGRVDVSSTEICASACWSGLTVNAQFSLDLGPFVVAKGEKVIPVTCADELINYCRPLGAHSSDPPACPTAPCVFEEDPDDPFPQPPPPSSEPPSACPASPSQGLFGSCGEDSFQCESATDCEDARPCTQDSCQGGVCVNLPVDANCDDANVCNGTETCDGGGGCQPGEFLDCDDGNVCTTDSCDPTSGCESTPQAGQACGGDACGVCDAQGGCQPCP